MKRCWFFCCLFVFSLSSVVSAGAQQDEAKIITFWPLLDYRHSDRADFTSINLLGPFLDYERKGTEREFALRPLYYNASDPAEGISRSDYFYPIGSSESESSRFSWQAALHLISSDFGQRESGSTNEFKVFPFLFYGTHAERGDYFALFPLGGKLYDHFGRDEIRFALFPLYGQTKRKGTIVTNILWPIGASIRGENERGFKLWPLYGASEKEGVYSKRFWLWPIFFDYRLQLDTPNPQIKRTVFPLYLAEDSPEYRSRTVLWPFFSHREDRRRDYEEWNLPWPLVRVASGRYRESLRLLPFYASERSGDKRTQWYLWPIYKIEETDTEVFSRRRDRVLYFLYSDLEETVLDEESRRLKRVALWPLFAFEEKKGIGHFHALALLEPFLPDNERIERSWAPLWRFYQRKWDRHGNEVSSLLWNLYWKERRGDSLAMEVFPLFRYRRSEEDSFDLSLLKGLIHYSAGEEGKRIELFYLPLGFSWAESPPRG